MRTKNMNGNDIAKKRTGTEEHLECWAGGDRRRDRLCHQVQVLARTAEHEQPPKLCRHCHGALRRMKTIQCRAGEGTAGGEAEEEDTTKRPDKPHTSWPGPLSAPEGRKESH